MVKINFCPKSENKIILLSQCGIFIFSVILDGKFSNFYSLCLPVDLLRMLTLHSVFKLLLVFLVRYFDID